MRSDEGERVWTVGELARRTGLTVRTLHHFDAAGVLSPARRSRAGYRLYTRDDVVRLQQALALRQVGFPLEEIRGMLDAPDASWAGVLELHLARLRERMEEARRLCGRVERLAERVRASAGEVPVDEVVRVIEEMTMFERYYTPEQMETLRERGEALGEEGMRRAQEEWAELIAAVRAEMEKGTDPASEPVRRLAARWSELVRAFTGGDPSMERSLSALYRGEERVAGMETGPLREMGEYVARALRAGG